MPLFSPQCSRHALLNNTIQVLPTVVKLDDSQLKDARKLLDAMSDPDVVSCSALFLGAQVSWLSRNGFMDEALMLFREFKDKGIDLNIVSWTSVMTAISLWKSRLESDDFCIDSIGHIQCGHSLIVCDAEKGLLEFGEDGVTILASHVNDNKIRLADDVIEAPDGSLYFSRTSTKFGLHDWYFDVLEAKPPDGSLYFSITSTKFGLHYWYFDVLEAKPHGQLLKYDPALNETSIVLDGLCFANGVALSADQDYLVAPKVLAKWGRQRKRVIFVDNLPGGPDNIKLAPDGSFWIALLEAPKVLAKWGRQRKTEIFVDNLPGGLENVKLAPDGSFWIALLQLTSGGLEYVQNSKALKHLVTTFPKLLEQVKGMHTKATVVNVATDGKIFRSFDDPDGDVMSFVISALVFEDHLYLGSLNSNFIGKLPLNGANYSSTESEEEVQYKR
ncbi:hypothetical protein RHMOL_Rhmol05G0005400 [Rhododendron molle]|uniref:Uncharacterized protein n=1 Tax=Rhododendron molle TaxID=49168 RepID=A0ACC0NKH9_RHOML|nr:hypothetical protein RHMOL_Rhmol05G0005400 [Rhododendron molle]